MPDYIFEVTDNPVKVSVDLPDGEQTVYQVQSDGTKLPLRMDGKTVTVGPSNLCVVIDAPGQYCINNISEEESCNTCHVPATYTVEPILGVPIDVGDVEITLDYTKENPLPVAVCNKTEICRKCMCDDVAGNLSDIKSYVEASCLTVIDGEVTSVPLGTFTDESLSTPYTPVNPINCDEIGEDIDGRVLEFCDGVNNFYVLYDVLNCKAIKMFDFNGPYTPQGPVKPGHCVQKQNLINCAKT